MRSNAVAERRARSIGAFARSRRLPGAAAAAFAWQARGQLQVTVVVKATFAFAPGAEMKLSEPQEVLLTEVYHRGQEGRVVRFANDRAPYLARADVVFTGHAHAPP